MRDVDGFDDLELDDLRWLNGLPWHDLKSMDFSELPPGPWLGLAVVQRLLRKLERHLLSLSTPSLGEPVVVISRQFDKLALAYKKPAQRSLLADAPRQKWAPGANGNDEGRSRNVGSNAMPEAGEEARSAFESHIEASPGEIRRMEEQALAVALEILEEGVAGRQLSAEEFNTQLGKSPLPALTMNALGQSANVPHTVAGVDGVYAIGGRRPFPKYLSSAARFRVVLGGFSDINKDSLRAHVISINGDAEHPLCKSYFKPREQYKVVLDGAANAQALRQIAVWDLQVEAIVTPLIWTRRKEIRSLTLHTLRNLDAIRPRIEKMFEWVQLEFSLSVATDRPS